MESQDDAPPPTDGQVARNAPPERSASSSGLRQAAVRLHFESGWLRALDFELPRSGRAFRDLPGVLAKFGLAIEHAHARDLGSNIRLSIRVAEATPLGARGCALLEAVLMELVDSDAHVVTDDS